MEFIKTKELSVANKEEIFALWNNEYPAKLTFSSLSDLEDYLKQLKNLSHTLVLDENQRLLGWYFDFIRENKKWFVLILNEKIQGKGIGTRIIEMAKRDNEALNGWVIDHDRDKKKNGQIYRSPLGFYLKNEFQILSDERLELDKISAVRIKWVRKTTLN